MPERTNTQKIQIFRSVFKGREDAFGSGTGKCNKEQLTDAILMQHFLGSERIGQYPLSPEIMDGTGTFWAVIDIDVNDVESFNDSNDEAVDALQIATRAVDSLSAMEIPSYIERSKSDGCHVWIFLTQAVDASRARALMHRAVEEVEREMGFRIREIFPKQGKLAPAGETGEYGNYLNLPLFGRDVPNGRTVFLDAENEHEPYPNQWEFLNSVDRVSPEEIDSLIESGAVEMENCVERSSSEAHTVQMERPGMERVLECDFIKHCRDNASQLPEPLWYAMISNLCRFDGGREKIHEYSQPYPGYSEAKTEAKIEHALNDTGPHTCQWIRENGFECQKQCGVKSPAALAYSADTEFVPLARIEEAEYEGREITTELMIAGIGYTYGVPREISISWQEKDGDKVVDKTGDFTIPKDSRILLDCFKQGDYQLNAMLQNFLLGRRPDAAKVKIHSRYTLRELLVVPKIQRWTDGDSSGDYDYKNFVVYYVDEAGPDEYIPILEDIRKIQAAELDSTNTETLLETFRDSHLVSSGELADILGISTSTVSRRTSVLKKRGLVKSSKKGYYKTPKFVAFLRRLETDQIAVWEDDTDDTDDI